MIHLPLRAKIALWSALAAFLALTAALVGIHYFLRVELLDLIDRRMEREAQELWWDLDRQVGGPVENRPEITEDLIPPTMMGRVIEIYGRNGKLEFRSANLRNETLGAPSLAPEEMRILERPYRVGTFYHKYLTLRIGYPLGTYYATLRRVSWAIIVVVPGVVLFSVLGGCWVAARALRPIQKISDTARQITAEDLHRRLPVPKAKDEIHQLTVLLNDAFSRLEKSYNQAMHFASDASHQLKTPITVMRAAIEDVLRDPTLSAEQSSSMSDLLQQTRRLASLTDTLLLLARADAGRISLNIGAINLVQVIEGCVEDAEILAAMHEIRIETELPATLPTFADPVRTEQILLNLLENAVKYNEPGGIIRVNAYSHNDGSVIRVWNTGSPIPADKAPHVFDRFVRGETSEARTGHGLGLALARELARAQRGEVSLVRSNAEGTTFELHLPAPARPAQVEQPALASAPLDREPSEFAPAAAKTIEVASQQR